MAAPRRQLGFLDDVAALLQRGAPLAGLGGDAVGYALARLQQGGRWLLLVDQEDRARKMVRALRFFSPDPRKVVHFPADDTVPYDGFSPDPAAPRARIDALHRLEQDTPVVVVASARALLQRVPTRAVRRQGQVRLAAGEVLDRDALVSRLAAAGYLVTPRVTARGQIAVRGDVADVWPGNKPTPVRIDWFDDEIETIRRLDPATGAPGRGLPKLLLLPVREDRLDPAALDRFFEVLGEQIARQDRGIRLRRRVRDELQAGIRFSAVEDWLPALVEVEDPLVALGDLRVLCLLPDDVVAAARDFQRTALDRWQALDEDERPLVPPQLRYAECETVVAAARNAQALLRLTGDSGVIDLDAVTPAGFAVQGGELAPIIRRIEELADGRGRVALVVEDGRRAERLLELLEPHGMMPATASSPLDLPRGEVSLLVGDLPTGFVCAESGLAYLPTSALFGGGARAARRQERFHTLFEAGVTDASQLKVGDPVVHRMHGIGRYQGMQRVGIKGHGAQDFVKLEYRGGDLLFLPVTSLAQLSRYTPSNSDVPVKLDRLGGQTWAARKGKIRDALLKMAEELLRLYARRETATREAWEPVGPIYRAFAARFPWAETVDQAAAIEAIQEDLSKPWPMDRLVCGDVGFGKTEVAMRAAMRVVEGGGQVAVLCPTTVLAYQHLNRFRKRFEGFGVEVAMLSRFNTPAEDKRVRDGLVRGSIDIVVGTTALLGRGVRYRRLGLVVVDEEHRFGVKQKDRFKRLRTEVDVLSMSATPIPRTLRMALSGLREMSIMATPPADRLEVRTTVAQLNESRVRDAIRQEMDRGGQVYVIHNRVQTIHRFADTLAGWVPDARFAVAHGQMKETELEQVLVDFIERRADVLVCTAIVESGIDLPNVNTMLIDRADLFGLSQLYQLRGRVGRSDVRASCILLAPEEITKDARKRLRVLVDHTRLGAGFHVAAADLELRGGGNVLGANQSGNIDKVGYDTWVELLQQAVRSAQGDMEREQLEPDIDIQVDAFIADAMVTDPHRRLAWYRRISDAPTPERVEAVLDELELEFGELPPETRNLGGLATTRLLCRKLGIQRCSWLKVRAVLEFHPSSPVSLAAIEGAHRRHPKRFKLTREAGRIAQISVRFTPAESRKPFRFLRWVFAQLTRDQEDR